MMNALVRRIGKTSETVKSRLCFHLMVAFVVTLITKTGLHIHYPESGRLHTLNNL